MPYGCMRDLTTIIMTGGMVRREVGLLEVVYYVHTVLFRTRYRHYKVAIYEEAEQLKGIKRD